MFTLSPLPFAQDALEPHISARTLEFHYGKHHQAYVDNLNKLIAGTGLEKASLEDILRATAGQPDKAPLFNNAAQIFNHSFFWNSLRPAKTESEPSPSFLKKINTDFGSLENLYAEFKTAATSQFGSGWAWLVSDAGKLKIMKTPNAGMPVGPGLKLLLTLDVWEHAYYLDYQNRRPDFAEAVIHHLLNWPFAEKNYENK